MDKTAFRNKHLVGLHIPNWQSDLFYELKDDEVITNQSQFFTDALVEVLANPAKLKGIEDDTPFEDKKLRTFHIPKRLRGPLKKQGISQSKFATLVLVYAFQKIGACA